MYIKRHLHTRLHFPLTVMFILVAVIVMVVALFELTFQMQSDALARHRMIEIDSFSKCEDSGYPVTQTFPRQCRVPNGPTFTEKYRTDDNVQGVWCQNECGDGVCKKDSETAAGSACPENRLSCPQDCRSSFSTPEPR